MIESPVVLSEVDGIRNSIKEDDDLTPMQVKSSPTLDRTLVEDDCMSNKNLSSSSNRKSDEHAPPLNKDVSGHAQLASQESESTPVFTKYDIPKFSLGETCSFSSISGSPGQSSTHTITGIESSSTLDLSPSKALSQPAVSMVEDLPVITHYLVESSVMDPMSMSIGQSLTDASPKTVMTPLLSSTKRSLQTTPSSLTTAILSSHTNSSTHFSSSSTQDDVGFIISHTSEATQAPFTSSLSKAAAAASTRNPTTAHTSIYDSTAGSSNHMAEISKKQELLSSTQPERSEEGKEIAITMGSELPHVNQPPHSVQEEPKTSSSEAVPIISMEEMKQKLYKLQQDLEEAKASAHRLVTNNRPEKKLAMENTRLVHTTDKAQEKGMAELGKTLTSAYDSTTRTLPTSAPVVFTPAMNHQEMPSISKLGLTPALPAGFSTSASSNIQTFLQGSTTSSLNASTATASPSTLSSLVSAAETTAIGGLRNQSIATSPLLAARTAYTSSSTAPSIQASSIVMSNTKTTSLHHKTVLKNISSNLSSAKNSAAETTVFESQASTSVAKTLPVAFSGPSVSFSAKVTYPALSHTSTSRSYPAHATLSSGLPSTSQQHFLPSSVVFSSTTQSRYSPSHSMSKPVYHEASSNHLHRDVAIQSDLTPKASPIESTSTTSSESTSGQVTHSYTQTTSPFTFAKSSFSTDCSTSSSGLSDTKDSMVFVSSVSASFPVVNSTTQTTSSMTNSVHSVDQSVSYSSYLSKDSITSSLGQHSRSQVPAVSADVEPLILNRLAQLVNSKHELSKLEALGGKDGHAIVGNSKEESDGRYSLIEPKMSATSTLSEERSISGHVPSISTYFMSTNQRVDTATALYTSANRFTQPTASAHVFPSTDSHLLSSHTISHTRSLPLRSKLSDHLTYPAPALPTVEAASLASMQIPTHCLEVAGEHQFSEICCAGIPSTDYIQLKNCGERWLQVTVAVRNAHLDGQTVTKPESLFTFPQTIYVERDETRLLKVSLLHTGCCEFLYCLLFSGYF